ncbi:MAG: hypothetical protein U5K36_13405 [Roseovarius sp.]|nr:hypothetical protein [Roseovarius sp.]
MPRSRWASGWAMAEPGRSRLGTGFFPHRPHGARQRARGPSARLGVVEAGMDALDIPHGRGGLAAAARAVVRAQPLPA